MGLLATRLVASFTCSRSVVHPPRWTCENRPFPDTAKPAISGVAIETSGVLLRRLLGAQVSLDLRAPAARSAFEHVRMMEQPIEQRGDRGGVAEQLSPVVDGSI